MSAWVEVPPLSVRALECECCSAVINVIARKVEKLGKVGSAHQIHRCMKERFSGKQVQESVTMLENAGMISMGYAGSTKAEPVPTLTDLGWEMAGIDKPIWVL